MLCLTSEILVCEKLTIDDYYGYCPIIRLFSYLISFSESKQTFRYNRCGVSISKLSGQVTSEGKKKSLPRNQFTCHLRFELSFPQTCSHKPSTTFWIFKLSVFGDCLLSFQKVCQNVGKNIFLPLSGFLLEAGGIVPKLCHTLEQQHFAGPVFDIFLWK